MIQFWTTWNFVWYSGFKLKFYNLNSPLKASIIATGLIGGYLVYIYPRRMKVKIGDYVYTISYPILILGDFVFHQYPLIDILVNDYSYDKLCVMYTYLPLFCWYNTANRIVDGKMDKLYGISVHRMLLLCTSVAAGFGVFHHLINNKK